MAKILGDAKDLEDYKQKIEKQRKLRKKTINSVKELLSKDECDFIASKPTQVASSDDSFLIDVYSPFFTILNQRQKRENKIITVKPFFTKSEISEKEGNPRLMTVQKLNADEELVSTIKNLPIYKNNSEKYEYLVKNNPQNKWIEEFKQTKEYKLLYD